METPDHDSGKTRRQCLQGDEITDAGFVQASTVVDHENVAGDCCIDRLEKDVDAPEMPCRTRTARDMTPRHQCLHLWRRAAHFHMSTNATIRDVCRGQRGETRANLIVKSGE